MNYYDKISAGYDKLHKEEQIHKLNLITNWIKQQNLGNNMILDVGCGTGFSLDILKKTFKRDCLGIEPSKGMIEQYKGKCKIFQASAEEIPFPDKFFSLIVSITAIQNFLDPQLGIQEILRVTEIGGIVVITCLKQSSKLKIITEELVETCTVLEVFEEDKDIIFCCKNI